MSQSPAAFSDHEWIVWELQVRDPEQVAPPNTGELTKQTMAEAAAAADCVFEEYVEGSGDDDTAHCAWFVRVPQREHQRRTADGTPIAVAALIDLLRSLLPATLSDWRAAPDEDLTVRNELDCFFKADHADVIDPVEVALLGLRRDGAQQLDPRTTLWTTRGGAAVGTYCLWLCRDPDGDGRGWLYLNLGYLGDDALWASPLGADLARYRVPRHTPLLMLPRPERPQWVARVSSATLHPGNAPVKAVAPLWSADNGQELADRLARDLRVLLPGLSG
jgi:hypothetical protein